MQINGDGKYIVEIVKMLGSLKIFMRPDFHGKTYWQ